ncbi:MAG TPA: SMC-Scp complex subunit ScpB, partial [Micrococcaceae bacterium]|nr:SMC-Scp complex subunit ScpB [Micrococcaceae bacterium]
MSEGPISGGDGLDQLPGGARAAVEAVLMVVDQPVTVMELATSLALPAERVQALLEELRADYDGYT